MVRTVLSEFHDVSQQVIYVLKITIIRDFLSVMHLINSCQRYWVLISGLDTKFYIITSGDETGTLISGCNEKNFYYNITKGCKLRCQPQNCKEISSEQMTFYYRAKKKPLLINNFFGHWKILERKEAEKECFVSNNGKNYEKVKISKMDRGWICVNVRSFHLNFQMSTCNRYSLTISFVEMLNI